mgnify:FL=1
MSALRIEKLSRQHAVEGFDCGREELNRYLVRFAWVNQQANAAQTYLGLTGDEVIGFYTLVVGEVAYDGAPQRLTKGLAKQPIGIMLLARFAVSLSWQGKRIGAGLLKDAMLRTMAAAEIAGIRALVVHAKDESAAAFYRRFDFSESPTDPRHLFVLIKDVKRALGAT